MYIGIDIQLARDFSYVVMNEHAEVVENGWVPSEKAAAKIVHLADAHGVHAIGIDAPRMPLPAPRKHYWNGGASAWRAKRASDRGHGRHCEVVVSACALARPQWTPIRNQTIPLWMMHGFALFSALEGAGLSVEEVFPSAGYHMLTADPSARVDIPLTGFLPGPKDMLDAIIAAFSVREFVQERGCEVGGGDGLGTIVLPRPVDHPKFDLVSEWPDE